ncbi:MAG: MBOAT family protein [Candidatus Omnitrophica bacterium]|nr:MBOAT family protein [Candidatus Omnitrophota bacterium]
MLFNSVAFFIFFVIVYALYLLSNHRWQNRILLVASYIFYGAWDWRFLSLIWLSTIVDYFCGLRIEQSDSIRMKKKFLWISVGLNLSLLGFFKYCNFFAANLQDLLSWVGLTVDMPTLKVVLPVGISFYTFQTMSYTIDIYKGKLKSTDKFFDFALFVAFFPQLVAGPIERAKNLLPQVLEKRKVCLQQFFEGCYLIFWGLFLKVFVADNLAAMVDPVFTKDPSNIQSGLDVLLAVYAFSFQIFGDFAGYSNIARGLSKCMGFEIMVNFRLPYFATNPQDFWRRWHISLSTWLRDYLYISLGGNRKGSLMTYRNLFLTMVLGGLWHGAAWTFVVWGIFHGILLVIYHAFQQWKAGELKARPPERDFFLIKMIKVLFFYHVTCVGWLIFRSRSIHQLWVLLGKLFSGWSLSWFLDHKTVLGMFFVYLGYLVVIQMDQYFHDDLMVHYKRPVFFRGIHYFLLLIFVIIFGVTGAQEFIYFQF